MITVQVVRPRVEYPPEGIVAMAEEVGRAGQRTSTCRQPCLCLWFLGAYEIFSYDARSMLVTSQRVFCACCGQSHRERTYVKYWNTVERKT